MRLTCVRNRGELAEGWYEPKMLEKARSNPAPEEPPKNFNPRASPRYGNTDSEEDDDYGPELPKGNQMNTTPQANAIKHGPSIANMQDLQVKREMESEVTEKARQRSSEAIRHERRADRNLQKERLDEIAPRAPAGTRERQLEKKREAADSNRSFAAAAHDNTEADVKDSDLMGDDGGGIEDLKRMKRVEERKRSEREVRREENQAAKRAETEERVKAMREREEKTMGLLREIARARFGGGA
jgi:hypothetical protein